MVSTVIEMFDMAPSLKNTLHSIVIPLFSIGTSVKIPILDFGKMNEKLRQSINHKID